MKIDPKDLSRTRAYRLLTSCIVPRPIAWVSTRSAGGIRNLAPFSFHNAVAATPPIVNICIGRRQGAPKDTARNIEETGEFVLNVVTESQAEAMNATSAEVPFEVDEFELAGLASVPSERVRPGRVAGCPVSLECRLVEILHPSSAPIDMVFGEVLLVHIDPSVWDGQNVDPARLHPVGRLGGSWYCRADLFEMPRPSS